MVACSTSSRGAILEHTIDWFDPLYGQYFLYHGRGQFIFDYESGTMIPGSLLSLENATTTNAWLAATKMDISDDSTIISQWAGGTGLPYPPISHAGARVEVGNYRINLLISPEAGESIGDPITVYVDLIQNITVWDLPGSASDVVDAEIDHLSDNSLDRVLTVAGGTLGVHSTGLEIPMRIGDQFQLTLESVATSVFPAGGTTAFGVAFQVAISDIPLSPPVVMPPPPLVPEPSSFALLLVGASCVVAQMMRRRSQSRAA